MFTGIIETTGEIQEVKIDGTNRHYGIRSAISEEFHEDQSVSHNGVCLTVTKVEGDLHWVTAIDETLKKTVLGQWDPGMIVNLERCMPAHGRFDGHIVQGHVDGLARVVKINEMDGSWVFSFEADTELMVEKGSVCLNGTSLTCYDVESRTFKVSIIPYTYEHTTFKTLSEGDVVNVEYDIIGKYLKKFQRI